jgi:hypothetical protein
MTPTPEQIRQALVNTQQQPRNHAPVIIQAIKNDESRNCDEQSGFLVSNIEVTDDGQKDISIS